MTKKDLDEVITFFSETYINLCTRAKKEKFSDLDNLFLLEQIEDFRLQWNSASFRELITYTALAMFKVDFYNPRSNFTEEVNQYSNVIFLFLVGKITLEEANTELAKVKNWLLDAVFIACNYQLSKLKMQKDIANKE